MHSGLLLNIFFFFFFPESVFFSCYLVNTVLQIPMPVHLINMYSCSQWLCDALKKCQDHLFSITRKLWGDQTSNSDVQVRFIKWEHFPRSRFRTGELSASGPTAASRSQPAVSSRACRCLSQDICTVLASQFISLGIGSLS